MNIKQTFAHVAAVAALAVAGTASAAPITPTSDTFGTLAAATFGGSGIPNTAVAISYLNGNANNAGALTMGLTAHQRCVGSNLTNNGAGVFTAFAGESPFDPGPGCIPGTAPGLATWNFATYVAGTEVATLTFVLFYDFDPAAGNDVSTHGTVTIPGSAIALNLVPNQGSQNLGFASLAVTDPTTGVVAPTGSFNAMVNGEYTFALAAFRGDVEVARSAILVNVTGGTPVSAPGTLALAGLALIGLAGLQRRRRA
jgi:hypothetical protein